MSTGIATEHTPITPGFVGRIPVRNLWLLMLYASDIYRHLGYDKVRVDEDNSDIPDLIAEILTHIVEKRLKRNLSFGYKQQDADLNRVRGRIDHLTTARRKLLSRGKIACHFEELTVDTMRNRYVRGALESLGKLVQRANLKSRCRGLAATMNQLGVSFEVPTWKEVSCDRISLQNRDDQLMVSASRLAFELALPTEMAGLRQLMIPDREIHWLRKLYERAVGGFYEVVLARQGWTVIPGRIQKWQTAGMTSRIEKLLPYMKIDIFLENPAKTQRLFIDTKFNSLVTKGWYRDESIRSGYLYQIYSYLRSQTSDSDPLSLTAAGLMLHPAINSMIDETVEIQGHLIRFATLDLGAEPHVIRQQLLDVVDFSHM